MAKATIESIVIALMLIVILLLILVACKPWRFFLSPSPSRLRLITPQVHDIERPLVSEDLNFVQNQSDDLTGIERTSYPTEGHFSSSQSHGYKQRLPSTDPQLTHSDSFVVDVISDPSEDVLIGQTLKRPSASQHTAEEQKYVKKEDLNYDLKFDQENNFRELPRGNVGSSLSLEVISGPCRGLRCSIQSTNASRLPLTIGRVPPSDLLLKDTEISGKHAMINWNLNKLKWEVVDMGSLNGTLLNSQAINHPDSGSRNWGNPIELASGDIITLGTSTKVFVQITSQADCSIPFGVGLASDPMALRRGAKKLPMEDVCYYRWPLPGAEEFGLFGVCDGHGGVSAATSASKMLPEMVSTILSDSFRRERVLSQRNASDVLRDAFLQTEACMNHYYEGCTATMLLVWTDDHENFFAQCANVGDSACVMNIDEKQIKMTEDHRITSYSERLRIQEIGEPLKDGETRLCGLNLGRMLGDKFLKQQDARFSSEPYISEVVSIHKASRGFALLASDGFWDVINFRRAIQLVQQARDNYAADAEKPAEMIANLLLSEARTLRTKDNTSIIFLDFDSISRNSSSCKVNP